MITTAEAIQSLVPNAPAHYISNTDDKITGWDVAEEKTGIPQPTDAEIQAEVIRLQAEYDSQDYARNRKAEYNQLNQDELRFDDLENGTTVWQDTINEIKARYPK